MTTWFFYGWGGRGAPPYPPHVKKIHVKTFFSNFAFLILAWLVSFDILSGMTTNEVAAAIKLKIEQTYVLAEKQYNRTFPRPNIDFGIKGLTAGKAYYLSNRLSFNLTLAIQEGEKFLNRTPAHEVAHLVARHLYGLNIQPHGKEWQSVMLSLGEVPSRCHNYEVKTNHTYSCACENKVHYLSTRKHNTIIVKGTRYSCTTCNQTIQHCKWHEKKPIQTSQFSITI